MKPLYNGMLAPSMVRRLADIWPEARHVVTELGERATDDRVWAYAREHGLVVITKDSDFFDEQRFPGPPPRAVRLRIGNATPAETERYLRQHAPTVEAFADSAARVIEV